MSVLSTVTSSLPNVLNLLQGRWGIQYKINTKQKSGQSILASFSNGVQNLKDMISGTAPLVDEFEWKDVDFDSFVDLQEIEDTTITQNPIEGGSFRSVNKVVKPKQVKVTIAKAGIGYGIEDTLSEIKMLLPLARYKGQKINLEEDEDTLLQSVKNLLTDVSNLASGKMVKDRNNKSKPNLPMEFRIVTPFDMIKNLNLVKMDYTFKKDNGRNMLLLYLTFEEVRSVSVGVTNVKSPSNSSNFSIGKLSAIGG